VMKILILRKLGIAKGRESSGTHKIEKKLKRTEFGKESNPFRPPWLRTATGEGKRGTLTGKSTRRGFA